MTFYSETASPSVDAERLRIARARFARMSWLLDNAFLIPGTTIRVGIEPLLGLVPGVGDLAGKGLSLYLVYEAARVGAPPGLIARMLGNVAIDLAIGAVPIAGDVADVFWRANRRNFRLFEDWLARQA